MQVLKPEMRKRILRSARRNFAVMGFEKARMRKISADADMTVGNLYRYYKNKSDLFEAVVDLFEDNSPRRALELRTQRAVEADPKKLTKLIKGCHDVVLKGLLGTV